CSQFAGHVENGAAVPAFDIPQTTDGSREWSQVRRFFVDRRRAEKTFVTERLHDYREVVEDLIVGLRQIGERDENTESHVRVSLKIVEDAVSNGDLPDIKAALSLAVQQVTETFVEQKKAYEAQLGELNSRMSNLRQDLVAAREEMKRDPLTDAYNRGAFDTAIEQSLNLHFVLNQPVTVVMVDLDNFKHVNDNFGHAAGDQALRAVGECLERTFIRKGDLVARYGGDEFAMILNDTSAQNATRLIERFLELAGNIRIADSADGAVVSCSAGYTEVHSSDSVETLVKRADRALYQAKAAGRNAARLLLHPDDEAAR
ncbi:MAG: GGDEF domain-containing protein, partial [Gammaproteobacteria bacterium]|nr:GGDEF domain-containing protein [Gammaproteobacteria bacterium]